jgi:hypothetical protein
MSTLTVKSAPGLPWRHHDGRTMAECVAEWLDNLPEHYFPPLTEPHARHAIVRGQFCGVRVAAADHRESDYLVTPAAMSACVAALGLPSDTPALLHEMLGDLVADGHLSDTLEAHRLPVLGKTWLYRVYASVREELPT